MKNLRKYTGALSRPLKQFGDLVAMDHRSFYDAGMQRSLNGNVVALVVRDVYSTLGAVCPAPSTSIDESTMALKSFVGDSNI